MSPWFRACRESLRLSYRNILYFKILSITIISFLCLYSLKLILSLIKLIWIKTIIGLRLVSIFCQFCFWNILIKIIKLLIIRFLLSILLETRYTIHVVKLLIISLRLLRIIVIILWRIIRWIIRILITTINCIIHSYFLITKTIVWILIILGLLSNILILLWLWALIIYCLLVRYENIWISI